MGSARSAANDDNGQGRRPKVAPNIADKVLNHIAGTIKGVQRFTIDSGTWMSARLRLKPWGATSASLLGRAVLAMSCRCARL